MKTCIQCQKELPLSEFYSHKVQGGLRLYPRCKPCHAAYRVPVQARHRAKIATAKKAEKAEGETRLKTCIHCKEEKPLSDFYTHKKHWGVHAYPRCKPCHAEYRKTVEVEINAKRLVTRKVKTDVGTPPCEGCALYAQCAKHPFSCAQFNRYVAGVAA